MRDAEVLSGLQLSEEACRYAIRAATWIDKVNCNVEGEASFQRSALLMSMGDLQTSEKVHDPSSEGLL